MRLQGMGRGTAASGPGRHIDDAGKRHDDTLQVRGYVVYSLLGDAIFLLLLLLCELPSSCLLKATSGLAFAHEYPLSAQNASTWGVWHHRLLVCRGI